MNKSHQKRKITGYDQGKADFIVAMFKTDYFSVSDVCKTAGICRTTFYKWIDTRPEFKAAIDDAKKELRERCTITARNSLLRRLTGFTITQRSIKTKPGNETDSDGNPIPVIDCIVETTREIPPDTKAIIFVLTSLDAKHWKRNGCIEILRPMPGNGFESFSDDELGELVNKLSARLEGAKRKV